MIVEKVLNERLREEYTRLKPYLNNEKCCQKLHKMCNRCENFLGVKTHNYEECRDEECFKFYLAYSRLRCNISYNL